MSIRHDRDMRYGKSRNKREHRPKTFRSEDTAKAYAESLGLKKYTLVNLYAPESQRKKLKIVAQ